MQLVAPVDLLPPSICIVCQTQPDGDFVVDTLRDLRTGVATPLNGRKYVCERCVGEFAKLFGYEHGTQVQRAHIDLQKAYDELANIRAHVSTLAAHIKDFVESPGAADDVPTPRAPVTPAEIQVTQAPVKDFAEVFGAPAEPTAPEKPVGSKSTIQSK